MKGAQSDLDRAPGNSRREYADIPRSASEVTAEAYDVTLVVIEAGLSREPLAINATFELVEEGLWLRSSESMETERVEDCCDSRYHVDWDESSVGVGGHLSYLPLTPIQKKRVHIHALIQ